MHFSQFTPTPALAEIIKSIWVLEEDSMPNVGQGGFERIFPDGSAEMIVHFGDRFLKRGDEKIERQERSFVFGQLSEHIELKPAGRVGVIGVKFHPWGLARLSRIPQQECSQQCIGLQDLFGFTDDLEEKIMSAANHGERVARIEEYLLDVLRAVRNPKKAVGSPAIVYAVKQLSRTKGAAKISVLANELNCSTRELERRFARLVGLPPKKLAAIFRFQHLFELAPQAASLTSLAHAAGYYDQSHFIRSFREIAGVNPLDFFGQQYTLTDAFLAGS